MFESLRGMFTEPLVRYPLVSSAIIGVLCSYLGIHVVLRRIVFVGASLAEISALGVAVAILKDWDPVHCSLVATFVGVLLFSLPVRRGRIPEDGYIGVAYASAWAAALLIVYAAPHGEAHVLTLMQGEILGVDENSVWRLGVAFGVIALLHVLFFKEFLMVSFDPEMSQTLGLRSWWWNFMFYLSLGVAISMALRLAGVLLVFAYLVLPPITGLLLSSRKEWVIVISALASLLASFLGVWWSFTYDVSTGPGIVACCFGIFVLAWVLSQLLRR